MGKNQISFALTFLLVFLFLSAEVWAGYAPTAFSIAGVRRVAVGNQPTVNTEMKKLCMDLSSGKQQHALNGISSNQKLYVHFLWSSTTNTCKCAVKGLSGGTVYKDCSGDGNKFSTTELAAIGPQTKQNSGGQNNRALFPDDESENASGNTMVPMAESDVGGANAASSASAQDQGTSDSNSNGQSNANNQPSTYDESQETANVAAADASGTGASSLSAANAASAAEEERQEKIAVATQCFRQAEFYVEKCTEAKEAADAKCDAQSAKRDNIDKAVGLAQTMYSGSKAGSGAQQQCFAVGLALNAGSKIVNDTYNSCTAEVNTCNSMCDSAALNRIINYCISQYPTDMQNDQKNSEAIANLKEAVADNSEICKVEKPGIMTKMSGYLESLGKSLQSAMICMCKYSTTGTLSGNQKCEDIADPNSWQLNTGRNARLSQLEAGADEALFTSPYKCTEVK